MKNGRPTSYDHEFHASVDQRLNQFREIHLG